MDFPGGPVAKTPHFQHRDSGLIPGQGTRSHMGQLSSYMLQLRPDTENCILKKEERKRREAFLCPTPSHGGALFLQVSLGTPHAQCTALTGYSCLQDCILQAGRTCPS